MASRLLNNDLGERFLGIDEKPLHFNEAGSKLIGTLEIAGAEVVKLKENHAATRERVSLMTTVTSSPTLASSASAMPLELLCKAKSKRRTAGLRPRAGMRTSIQWAEKGSYRTENILAFLEKWLDPWNEMRERTQDWRILMLDVAKSHTGDEIVRFAHTRGYVTLYHYGCTTGIAQVNGTDCHGDLSRIYIELEMESFRVQQMYDPGDISRSLQLVLHDVEQAWCSVPHNRGVRGHKFNGLTNRLDGSEDHLISREAKNFWQEMGMPEARANALREVDELIDKGEIATFVEWQKLVRHPVNPGVAELEGEEFEGELQPDEKPWLTEADVLCIEEDEAGRFEHAVAEYVAPPEDLEALRLQSQSVNRLAQLKSLRANSLEAGAPSAAVLISREIKQVERGLHGGGKPERQAATLMLRDHMDRLVHKQRTHVRAAQKRSRKLRLSAHKLKLRSTRAKRAKQAAAKKKAAYKKKVDTLPLNFSAEATGKPGTAGRNERQLCLERLKIRSPPLTFQDEFNWLLVRNAYTDATVFRKAQKLTKSANVGPEFIQEVNHVLKKLGEHYSGPTRYNEGGRTGGSATAFVELFKRMQSASMPRAAIVAGMG